MGRTAQAHIGGAGTAELALALASKCTLTRLDRPAFAMAAVAPFGTAGSRPMMLTLQHLRKLLQECSLSAAR